MKGSTIRALTASMLLASGCSAGAVSNGAGRADGRVLTQAQLAATNASNVYDAIDKLRAEWLTSRGPTSVTDPTPTLASVYMNGQMLGKVEYLRQVGVMDVTEVRFWPAGEASARFGMGHPRGVIELTRR